MFTSYQAIVFPDEAESCRTFQDYKKANKKVDDWLIEQAGQIKHDVVPHPIYGGLSPKDLVSTAKAIIAHNIDAPADVIDSALKAIRGRHDASYRANREGGGGPDIGHKYYLDKLEEACAILTNNKHASTPVVSTRPLDAAAPQFQPSFIVSENCRPVAPLDYTALCCHPASHFDPQAADWIPWSLNSSELGYHWSMCSLSLSPFLEAPPRYLSESVIITAAS